MDYAGADFDVSLANDRATACYSVTDPDLNDNGRPGEVIATLAKSSATVQNGGSTADIRTSPTFETGQRHGPAANAMASDIVEASWTAPDIDPEGGANDQPSIGG